jgi:hypothetical protein
VTASLLVVGLGGVSLFVLLSLALRHGYTKITTAPAGGCLCPEIGPADGELTPAQAAALYERHRHCPGCPLGELARAELEKAESEPVSRSQPR